MTRIDIPAKFLAPMTPAERKARAQSKWRAWERSSKIGPSLLAKAYDDMDEPMDETKFKDDGGHE